MIPAMPVSQAPDDSRYAAVAHVFLWKVSVRSCDAGPPPHQKSATEFQVFRP